MILQELPVLRLSSTAWVKPDHPKHHFRVGCDDLYGFLITDPNELVKPTHEKATSVLLQTSEETDFWMMAPCDEASTSLDHFRRMR